MEEIETLVKKNLKSKKFLTLNSQEIWDNMKKSNLTITGIEKEESHIKGTESILTES